MANTDFSKLDFDDIKENLKDFLSSKTEYQDYNFEGSAMNLVLDALAYATHYNGVHANLAISEAFLDTAQIRNSVVSRAKELNYMPRQRSAAAATIKLSITPTGNPASIVIPKGTKFSAKLNNRTYPFVTPDVVTMTNVGGGVFEAEFQIVQGVFQKQEWTYNSSIKQNFIINQPDIDMSYLKVEVKDNAASAVVRTYTYENDITTIDDRSKVYFAQEVDGRRVEVYFGDGVLGAKLSNNNIIIASFLTTKGPEVNGANVFELTEDIAGYSRSNFTLTSIQRAEGGAERENLESVKLIAPKNYQAQSRAVTSEDYKALLLKHFGWIEAISIWGGEDAKPAQFGKVLVAIKPDFGTELSPAFKKIIQRDVLEKYNIVGIVPQLVDPDYTFVDVDCNVIYDRLLTTLTAGSVQGKVESAIQSFFQTELQDFNKTLRYSRLVAAIDNADESISNNKTKLKLTKNIVPPGFTTRSWIFEYNNPLEPGTFLTDTMTDLNLDTHYVKDDGNGQLNAYKNGLLFENNVGSINYDTGTVDFPSYMFPVPDNTEVYLRVQPRDNDVVTVRNSLLVLGQNNVTTTVLGVPDEQS